MRIASLLMCLALSACTPTPSPAVGERELNAADANAAISANVGQVFVVNVTANPGTGFSWAWDEAASAGVLAPVGDPAMTGTDPQRVGSGGTQTWRFRAIKAGEGELRLDYRRPWETGTPPAQTVRWTLRVR